MVYVDFAHGNHNPYLDEYNVCASTEGRHSLLSEETVLPKQSLLQLGGAAVRYAAFLNTPAGKKFATEYTWASVVVGTGLVLAFLKRELDDDDWAIVAQGFAVAGAPMIARSVINQLR